jgi:hypothetical protein
MRSTTSAASAKDHENLRLAPAGFPPAQDRADQKREGRDARGQHHGPAQALAKANPRSKASHTICHGIHIRHPGQSTQAS